MRQPGPSVVLKASSVRQEECDVDFQEEVPAKKRKPAPAAARKPVGTPAGKAQMRRVKPKTPKVRAPSVHAHR